MNIESRVEAYLNTFPPAVQVAIKADDYLEATDLMVRTGAHPPVPLLEAASRQATEMCPSWWVARVEPYQGHVRIVMHKKGKEPAVED